MQVKYVRVLFKEGFADVFHQEGNGALFLQFHPSGMTVTKQTEDGSRMNTFYTYGSTIKTDYN